MIPKKPSKKTLHRLSRIRGIKSERREQNQVNAKVVAPRHMATWKRKVRPCKGTAEHLLGLEIRKHLVSTKLSLQQQNMLVVKEHGYMPKATKAKKIILRIQPRNIRVDGWTCKERRLILLAQRKLQRAA